MKPRFPGHVLLAAAVALQIGGTPSVAGFNDVMTFTAQSVGGNCPGCHWVLAQGRITKDTPALFTQFVGREDVGAFEIEFHSPGGDLAAALQLGNLIRKHGFNTSVSYHHPVVNIDEHGWQTVPFERDDPDEVAKGNLDVSRCMSACTYAFLGGKDRRVNINAQFAVHQFYSDDDLKAIKSKRYNAEDLSEEQKRVARLSEYVSSMGVDPALVNLASKVSPWRQKKEMGVRVLSPEELLRLNVVTTGPSVKPWSIEARGRGVVAQTSKTQDGEYNRFDATVRIACRSNMPGITLFEYVRPAGKVNAQELAKGLNEALDPGSFYVQLSVDDRPVRQYSAADIGNVFTGFRAQADNQIGFIAALSARDVRTLANGRELQITMELPGTFKGFAYESTFPMEQAEQKIQIAMRNCL